MDKFQGRNSPQRKVSESNETDRVTQRKMDIPVLLDSKKN